MAWLWPEVPPQCWWKACGSRASAVLLFCHLTGSRTHCGSSDSCYHWSCTAICNDGKIQGQTLEGSLSRYFLQILSWDEVREAVSSHYWHTWAMSHAVGRCKGMEIHGNMMLSERTIAVKFISVICEADNTCHKSQNKTEMCGNCESFWAQLL